MGPSEVLRTRGLGSHGPTTSCSVKVTTDDSGMRERMEAGSERRSCEKKIGLRSVVAEASPGGNTSKQRQPGHGVYISQLVRSLFASLPETAITPPETVRVVVCPTRASVRLPVLVHLPVLGL